MIKEFFVFCIYFIVAFILVLSLSLNYASSFISVWCNCLEEGFVLHDSTEWVWAVWMTAFFLCFWFLMPYYFFLIYLWIKNFSTKIESLFIKIGISLFFYSAILSFIIFLKDLFLSGFFLPSIKNISFEFQPGIESYLNFIFGLFFDLFNSFIIFQLFIIAIFMFKNLFLQLKKYIIILYIFTLCLFFYWFGGEGILSDFFLCLTIIILNQILILSILIFKHLRMYKI